MSTFAASRQQSGVSFGRPRLPKFKWMDVWDGCLFYVRRSNYWPNIPEHLALP